MESDLSAADSRNQQHTTYTTKAHDQDEGGADDDDGKDDDDGTLHLLSQLIDS